MRYTGPHGNQINMEQINTILSLPLCQCVKLNKLYSSYRNLCSAKIKSDKENEPASKAGKVFLEIIYP